MTIEKGRGGGRRKGGMEDGKFAKEA